VLCLEKSGEINGCERIDLTLVLSLDPLFWKRSRSMFATQLPRRTLTTPIVTIQLLLACACLAGDPAGSPDMPSNERIARLIQQLDAGEFSARKEASRNLQQLGPAACPALAKAAVEGSREQRMRALEILGQHFQEGETATKQAAKQALEQIAASDHEASARRAKDILQPKKEQPMIAVPNIAPAQIQIQVEAIAGGIGGRGVQRIQVRNGVRQMETDDGQRKVKIVEDPDKGIEVEITQKQDGKETTEKFQAKNAEELAKKDPEIHRLYQNMQNVGGMRIQAVPGGILPGNPLQQRIPLQAPDARRRTAIQMMQASRKMLADSIQLLQQSKGQDDEAQKIEETIQRLKAVIKQIEEQEDKFGEN
jgi:hypothetical protein